MEEPLHVLSPQTAVKYIAIQVSIHANSTDHNSIAIAYLFISNFLFYKGNSKTSCHYLA